MKKILCLLVIVALLFTFVVITTVSANRIICITEYGASVNNDDNITQIRAAFNAARSGDTIIIPSGVFRISSSINLRPGITIEGEDGATILYTSNDRGDILHGDPIDGAITIRNLILDGGNNVTGHGINLWRGHNSRIERVTVKNIGDRMDNLMGGASHGIRLAQSNFVVIIDCHIENIGTLSYNAGGIFIGQSHDVQILRNFITRTGRGGIFTSESHRSTIIGNTITNVAYGTVGGVPSGRDHHGLSIEVFNGGIETVVEDNVVDTFISLGGVRLAARRNVAIMPQPLTFATRKYAAMEAGESRHAIFTDNLGVGQLNGLMAYSMDRVFFGHNTWDGSAQNGSQFNFHIDGDSPGRGFHGTYRYHFYDNDFTNTHRNHPMADTPGADGRGLRIQFHVSNFVFDNVRIDGNGTYGIEIGHAPSISNILIENSTIRNNASAFNATGRTSSAVILEGTVVEGNGNNLAPNNVATVPRPVPIIDSPTFGYVGHPITFYGGNSYSPNGTIYDYLWDFDFGPGRAGATQEVVFTEPGLYRVTLIVWNNGCRSASVNKIISIRDPARPNMTLQRKPAPTLEHFRATEFGIGRDGNQIGELFVEPNSITLDSVVAAGVYVTASARVRNNSEHPANGVAMIIAFYNSRGVLQTANLSRANIEPNLYGYTNMSVSLRLPSVRNFDEDGEVRVFVWRNLSTMTPICYGFAVFNPGALLPGQSQVTYNAETGIVTIVGISAFAADANDEFERIIPIMMVDPDNGRRMHIGETIANHNGYFEYSFRVQGDRKEYKIHLGRQFRDGSNRIMMIVLD